MDREASAKGTVEYYVCQEELERRFPLLGTQYAREVAQRRARDRDMLEEWLDRGIDVAANWNTLIAVWKKEDQGFASWEDGGKLCQTPPLSREPVWVLRADAIRQLHGALDDSDARQAKERGEEIDKPTSEKNKRKAENTLRRGRRVIRDHLEYDSDNDAITKKSLARWFSNWSAHKDHPGLESPWQWEEELTRVCKGVSICWESGRRKNESEKVEHLAFTKELVTAVDRKHIPELQRAGSRFWGLAQKVASLEAQLAKERERNRVLSEQLADATTKKSRKNTNAGRPRGSKNKQEASF